MIEAEPTTEVAFLTGLFEEATSAPNRAGEVAEWVTAEDFSDDTCRKTFAMLRDVVMSNERPVMGDFVAHSSWGECRDVIMECVSWHRKSPFGHCLRMDMYASAIKAAAARRRVADAVYGLRRLDIASASSTEISAAVEAVSRASESVSDVVVPVTLSTAIKSYLKQEQTPRIVTTFGVLDDVIGGGLPIGGLTVFAAQPSIGKSALALQVVIGALDRDDSLRAVWCLGEMTEEAFARRAVCVFTKVRHGLHPVTMVTAERRDDVARGVAIGLSQAIGERLTIVRPALTIQRIEDAVVASGAKLLVVDYVQLVEMEAEDRRGEVDGVVKRLRRLSLERDVAIVAISNISKSVAADTRIGAIGKESSELDFAADVLLLGTPDNDEDGAKVVRWSVKKNRHGECRDLICRFEGQYQWFSDAMAVPSQDFVQYARHGAMDANDPNNWGR